MTRIFRISTVPVSLNVLLKGQLKFLNRYFDVIAVSSSGVDLQEVEMREGVQVMEVEMQRKIAPLKDLWSLIKLYTLFKVHKPEIVHSITPKAGLLSMLAAKFAGVPVRMHTFTGLIFPSKTGLLQKLLIRMDQLLCWAATDIYPEGQGVLNDLKKYNITSKPLRVLANGNVNGIDLAYFDPAIISKEEKTEIRKSLNLKEDDFIYVFVGRLVRDKGINELVEAFRNLNNHKCRLLLVGPLESELDPLSSATLNEINKNRSIISVGFQTDVRPYLSVSDVFVFPSYREGFPNVVMQAGAMGLPAIVTDINGSNEIIVNNENGVIIPSKNALILQEEMHKMFCDRNRRNWLKSNSRKLIEKRFDQKVVWEALLNEYQKLEKNVPKYR